MSYKLGEKHLSLLNERLYGESIAMRHFGADADSVKFEGAKHFTIKRRLPGTVKQYSVETGLEAPELPKNTVQKHEITDAIYINDRLEAEYAFLDDKSMEEFVAETAGINAPEMAKEVDASIFKTFTDGATELQADEIVKGIMEATATLENNDAQEIEIFVGHLASIAIKTSGLLNVGGDDAKENIKEGAIGTINSYPVYPIKDALLDGASALVLDPISVFTVSNYALVDVIDNPSFLGKQFRMANYAQGFVDEGYEHLLLKVVVEEGK